MDTLNTVSSDCLVHVVFEENGKRRWFHHTDRRYDAGSGRWTTTPVVDDDPRGSSPMKLSFAVIAQSRWKDIGIECRFALEPNGPFIDPDLKSDIAVSWPHVDALVTVDADGNLVDSPDASHVYRVRAVRTTEGPKFCLRFENPILQNQSQFSTLAEGPEVAVRRAIDRGYTKLEKPQVNPWLEKRQQEAQRQAQRVANARFANLRPGDRR